MKNIFILSLISLVIFLPVSVAARNLEESTVNIIAKSAKSVVCLTGVATEKVREGFHLNVPFDSTDEDIFQTFFKDYFGRISRPDNAGRVILGSGVIVDKQGYIVTNIDAVSRGTGIKVHIFGGREFNAEIKVLDKGSGIAVIKIDTGELVSVKMGDSDKLKIGEWVVALGSPLNVYSDDSGPIASAGIVSALRRYLPFLEGQGASYEDLIQTDAEINPANSGGPLFDLNGNVVGINILALNQRKVYGGLGFAIPINKAKGFLDKLIKGEKVVYGWLGVNIHDLNDELRNYFGIKQNEGVIVLKVYRNSPAEKSGFKEGDLIVSFDNSPVILARDLIKAVSSTQVGKIIPFKIIRSGKELMLNTEIGTASEGVKDSDEEIQIMFRGVTVDNINDEYKKKFNLNIDEGIVVVSVEKELLIEKNSLRPGDVIYEVENRKITSKDEFREIILKAKKNYLLKTSQGYVVLKNSD